MESFNTLITGGVGFIGSYLVVAMCGNPACETISILDDFSKGRAENIPESKKIRVDRGDVAEPAVIEEAFAGGGFNYVVHLAAIASVQETMLNPVSCHWVNSKTTLLLLKKISKSNPAIRLFVFASSAAVNGDNPVLQLNETSAVSPKSPYGLDKVSSEQYTLTACSSCRPRQDHSSPYSGVLSIFTRRFMEEESVLMVFGDYLKKCDFVYVKDILQALSRVLFDNLVLVAVYNAANGMESSLLDVIAALEKLFGEKTTIEFKDARQWVIKKSPADVGKIGGIGFTSGFSLKGGLREYSEFVRERG